jgi:parvulin-like peptidyl-prolyl isomerase
MVEVSHMKLLVLFLCLSVACTKAGTPSVSVTVPVNSAVTTSAGQSSSTEEKKEAEEAKASLEKLPDFPAQPVLKGTPAPDNGILISPRHAAEAALDAAEADKLTVENRVITSTREKELALLEDHIKKQEEELAQCRKKSFWDRQGNAVMLGVGVIVGIGMSLATFKVAVRITDK